MLRIAWLAVLLACSSNGADVDASSEVDAQACRADCECAQERGECCEADLCRPESFLSCHGRPLLGFCGPGGDCPCVGGTCDSRRCCVLPDGGVDDGLGQVCQPIDGGP